MLDRIESALGRWGRFVYRRAGWVLAAILLAAGVLGTQLAHFRLDASTKGFFHEDDPVRAASERLDDQYGRSTLIVALLEPRGGVFDLAFLERLRTIHEEIEAEVPHLEEVTSLINARDTRGFEDRLDVGELLEEWPASPDELAAIAGRARENPNYRDSLLSADGRKTTIAIETLVYRQDADLDVLAGFGAETEPDVPREFLGIQEDKQIAAALREIAERHRSDDLAIHLSGPPLFNVTLAGAMEQDMGLFTGLCVLIIAVALGLSFGRLSAIALPLLTVVLTVVSTLSVMSATRTPLMPPTQIVPSFLLAVGVGGTVHLLTVFYQARRRGEDEESAIGFALSHSGLAIVMTALTTAAGLLSFIPTALAPISHFGIFTPIGVLLGLFLTLTFLPALIGVVPTGVAKAERETTRTQALLVALGRQVTRHKGLVLVAWAALLLATGSGIAQLRIGHDMLEWFPHRDPIYQATKRFDADLGGVMSYSLLVGTGRENGYKDPEFLQKLDRVQQFVDNHEVDGVKAGKTLALTDIVKETHRALNADDPAFYAIPTDRRLVAQELLLFENGGSDDVEDFVDPSFENGRVSVRVPFVDGARYIPYLNALMPEVERILGPGFAIDTAGFLRLMGNTIAAALDTMLTSYASALVIITVLMIVLIGDLRMGLVSMIPNLAPVVSTLGLMGWLGIQLDMFTLMIGSIVLGLAVDDTIHFMHNFRRYYEESGSAAIAVDKTLASTGQAMLFTTLILTAGFLVYTQAYMVHLFAFGLLTAFAVALAFIADVTLAPALVTLVVEGRGKRET